MIFTGFKRKSNQIFFNNKLPSWIKIPVENPSEEVKKVLVFLDDISEKNKIQHDLMTLFNIKEAAIEWLIFQQKIEKESIVEGIYTPKDFGWYGKINSAELKAILTKKYDLLINYAKVDNLYSNLVLLQCKAGFRAGFAHLDSRLYDLMIDCKPGELKLFNKELKKYLAILNKK